MEVLASASGMLTGPDYQVRMESGKHRFLADEPEQFQGLDTGPDPYSLVLSGLVSCTAITLKMYAVRKGWPLENAEVECRLIKAEAASAPEIIRTISLKGELSEEQKQRLLQIASACPVHKMLSLGNAVHSSLA